jgi:replicative DNA helicase
LFIDDTPSLSIFDLRAKQGVWCRNTESELLLWDYLQLTAGGNGKEGETESRNLDNFKFKSIAKELNVPVIALSTAIACG